MPLQIHNYNDAMTSIRFEWDGAKAALNLRKHGVSFELAARIFTDPFVLIERDRIEDGEQRWQADRVPAPHHWPHH